MYITTCYGFFSTGSTFCSRGQIKVSVRFLKTVSRDGVTKGAGLFETPQDGVLYLLCNKQTTLSLLSGQRSKINTLTCKM